MTTVSASPATMAGMSPMLLPNEQSSPVFQFADSSSEQHRRERSSSIKSPKKPGSPAASPSTSTPNNSMISNKADAFKTSYSHALPPINETTLSSSSDHSFPSLNPSTIARVASMSLEEALEASTHLQPRRSSQDSRGQLPTNSDHALTSRDRAFSAPVNLDVLDKKLEAFNHQSVFTIDIDHSRSHAKAVKTLEKKPTAKEVWVADLDCVSDIFGAMLADGDRGRW